MEGILVDISDHPILPIKRKIEVRGFMPSWPDENVRVFLMVKHYIKNTDNSYGEAIVTKSINDYEDFMVASNIRKVDPTDGMECIEEIVDENIIYKRLDTQTIVNSPIGQFSFFDYIIRTTPVQIGQMLTNFVLIDDQIKNKWNK